METVDIPGTGLKASQIIYGCMRLSQLIQDNPVSPEKKIFELISCALEMGINMFDHADIYGGGKSEELFGLIWKMGIRRENIILQTKCGIIPGKGYCFDANHIRNSVEGSLKRLQTDYIDILLLHRPDLLMDPEEVANILLKLQTEGKVRFFGVSNFTCWQCELLRNVLPHHLVTNQIRLSLLETSLLDAGIVGGGPEQVGSLRGEGMVEYAMIHRMRLQAYSPVAGGRLLKEDVVGLTESQIKLRERIFFYAQQYHVTPEAIMVSWIMRHPAKIQPIIGTINTQRLIQICRAQSNLLTRTEWYDLFIHGRGRPLP